MSDISNFISLECLRENILKEIKEKLKFIFCKYLKESDFDTFIDKTLKEAENELMDYGEINEINYTNLINRMQRTKVRWVKKELESDSLMFKEINIIAKGLHDLSVEKFKSAYGLDTVEELLISKKKELNNWSKDNSSLITDFSYISSKSNFQMKSALKNDIKLIFIKNIISNSENNKEQKITRMPTSIGSIPYDSTNRAKLKLEKVEAREGVPAHYVDKYKINDNTTFESIIDAKVLKSQFSSGVINALNENDFNVLIALLSFIDNDFYSSREVLVSTKDLTVSSFGEDSYSGERRNTTKDSLFKMQHINTGIVDSLNRGFTFKIIDNVDIIAPKTNGIELISVVFNRDIVKQIVENNTINMYSDVINNFKLPGSKIIFIRLETERVSLPVEGQAIKELSFDFFRKALYFPSSNRYRNIKRVETALNEIISNKVSVKSFHRKGSNFILEFYPISDKEKKDLFNSPAPSIYLDSV